MLTKKKDNMLRNLANLLAIQNDYVQKDDADTVVALYAALATGIDHRHGGDKLIEYAREAYKIRHPDYAENSASSIGGETDEHSNSELIKETAVH